VATSEVSHGGAIGGVGSALLVLVPARRPWYKKKGGGGGEGPGCFRIHAHTQDRAWLCIENSGNAGTPPPAESVTLRTGEHGLAPGCGRPHERDSVRGGGEEDPVTPVPVNTRAEAWFSHIGNLGNAGTAFRCRDGYIEPVNAGQGPVASGSANAFSARGGMTANGELGAGRVVQLRAPHECGAARTGRRASQR
jgi:hypothetical protein